jgi:hypothetical protein
MLLVTAGFKNGRREQLVIHAWTLATQEAEIRRVEIQAQPGQIAQETPISTNGWVWWHLLVTPATVEGLDRRIMGGVDKKQDPIFKRTRTKRTGVMAHVPKRLPSNKHEALSSNPSTRRRRRRGRRRKKNRSLEPGTDSPVEFQKILEAVRECRILGRNAVQWHSVSCGHVTARTIR